ncbi:MAG: DUF3857 domain-containing protein [Bacteroidales bacterium]|nr:DUF3857 domain-containing protein [Bacteroidales bacterium]
MRIYLSFIILLFLSTFCHNDLVAQQTDQVNSTKQYKQIIEEWENQILTIEENIRNSENIEEQHILARIYFYLNYYDKTLDILEYLSANDILSNDEKNMLALIYYQKGKLGESIYLFKSIYSEDKSAYQAKYYIAKIANDLNVFSDISTDSDEEQKVSQPFDSENYYADRKEIEKYIFSEAIEKNIIVKKKISEITDISNEIKELITCDSIPLFKDASAGIIDLQTNYTVTKNNNSIYSEKKIIKILNEKGKESYSDIQIGYDASFQNIEIERIRVYTRGEVYEIPNNYIRTVAPWSGSYSNYKVAIINSPNIEINSVIEYKYKLITHNSMHPNNLQFSISIHDVIPILKQKHEVSYSKNKKLNLKFPESYKPVCREDTANIYYSWNIDSKKAFEFEENAKLNKSFPIIKGSFFESWDEVYKWLKPYYLGENIELSTELKDFIKLLTKDAKDDLKKIELIYNWINKNIRYIAIEIGQGGVYPRNVNEIYANRFGDCKDQSTLLVSFLRELGIEASPVLINTSSRVDMDSTLSGLEFSHCITYIKLKDKEFFCDVIAKQTPYYYLHPFNQNRLCYIINDDTYDIVKTPIASPDENMQLKKMNVKLLSDGSLIVDKYSQNNGNSNTAFKNYFIGMNDSEIKENIQYDISYFCPGGILESYDIKNINTIDNSIVINETFTIPNWLVDISDEMYYLKIPTVYFSFDELDQIERKYDLHYETTESKKYNIEIEIPENYIIYKLPENKTIKTDAIEFKYKYLKGKDKLILSIEYSRGGTDIEVDKYEEFKKHHDEILNKVKESIILQKI